LFLPSAKSDLNKRATQQAFADLMSHKAPPGQSIAQQAVQKLCAAGVLPKGGTLADWAICYGRHMNDIAARWVSADGTIDRIKEAGLLDRARRKKLELEIAEMIGELLPVELLVEGLSLTFTAVRARMLALASKLRVRNPNWTPADSGRCDEQIRELL
jgi:hypothetical protein